MWLKPEPGMADAEGSGMREPECRFRPGQSGGATRPGEGGRHREGRYW